MLVEIITSDGSIVYVNPDFVTSVGTDGTGAMRKTKVRMSSNEGPYETVDDVDYIAKKINLAASYKT